MPKRRRSKAPPPLSELEAEVMEDVWGRGASTVRDVLESLNAGPKQRAYTTVMTIMTRLDEKRILTRKRQGKTDVYRAAISREAYRAARAEAEVGAVIAQFGELALAQFAAQAGTLDARRVRELRRLAEGG
jgi:predicted transcriptional regulator